jgi:hypothetical protein
MARARARRVEDVITKDRADAIKRYVRDYLAECRTNQALLRATDHPTITGCLKVVYHVNKDEEAAIRAAYAAATRTRAA